MSYEAFEDWSPTSARQKLLEQAKAIIAQYRSAGYRLTVRQTYYQLVARDIIPNNQRSYKRIVDLLARGRMAGMVDWEAIEDRGRTTNRVSTWDNPGQIVRSAAHSYRVDPWENQPYWVEVMCEKDALSGVLRPVCDEYRVAFTANKGYSSLSHLKEVGERLRRKAREGKEIQVIYFGDHDPSGLDMDRDLDERLSLFSYWTPIDFTRAALLFEQVQEFNPPPNPAKFSDSRAPGYVSEYGTESWELDAVEPEELARLVRARLEQVIDHEQWEMDEQQEDEQRQQLLEFAGRWED